MTDEDDRRPSLQSLERGIAVIQVFSRERPALTLSEVARLTGITRATARRILLTLQEVGHVRSDGRLFSLTPRVLTLGWAYLSSLNLWETAQPMMEELARTTNESCSAATLDLPDVVYVARMPTRRIMTISLGVGTRLPAHCTGMGRVLLAGLPDAELDAFLADAHLEAFTERTITDRVQLRETIETVRRNGWWERFYEECLTVIAANDNVYVETGLWWRELYERPLMDPNIGSSKLLWGTDWGASMQIYSQPGRMPPSYPVQLRNEGIPHYQVDYWGWSLRELTSLRIAQDDMNLILGGNAARIFKLDVPHTRLFKPPSDHVGREARKRPTAGVH